MIVFGCVDEAKAAEEAARDMWNEQVKSLVCSRWYRNQDAATKFFVRRLYGVWLDELERSGVDVDDETNLERMLGITPTMLLLIHLFAYGYEDNRRELGLTKGKAPAITCWPPLRRGQTIHFYHAIPKRDIGRIVGKSQDAIETAMSRFRGRGRGSELIRDRGLVQPIAIQTGIMLDVRLSKQLQFLFMREDYELGRSYASKQSAAQTDTWETQAIHCGRAISGKIGIRVVDIDASTGTDG